MAYKMNVVSKAAITPRTVWGDLIREINDKLRNLAKDDAIELRFESMEEANTAQAALRNQLCVDSNGRKTSIVVTVRRNTIFVHNSNS